MCGEQRLREGGGVDRAVGGIEISWSGLRDVIK